MTFPKALKAMQEGHRVMLDCKCCYMEIEEDQFVLNDHYPIVLSPKDILSDKWEKVVNA